MLRLANPSLSHRLVSAALPRLRRSATVTDVAAARARLVELNRGRRTEPPRAMRRRYDVAVRDPGFPAFVLTPRGGRAPRRTVLHIHGGSYTSPAAVQQWRYAARVARRAGDARIVFPAYPLAPEHTWRDSHPQMVRLAQDLLAEGPVVLSGDSAGGGYALSVAEAVRDAGGPQPSHLVLLAPWVDLTSSSPGIEDAGLRDPWLNHENLDVYAEFWAGSREDLSRWEVSPMLGDLRGLPRTLVFCGTHDILHPGCVDLAQRAAAAGWDLELVEGEGMLHVYPLLPVAEARPALRRIAEFLRS